MDIAQRLTPLFDYPRPPVLVGSIHSPTFSRRFHPPKYLPAWLNVPIARTVDQLSTRSCPYLRGTFLAVLSIASARPSRGRVDISGALGSMSGPRDCSRTPSVYFPSMRFFPPPHSPVKRCLIRLNPSLLDTNSFGARAAAACWPLGLLDHSLVTMDSLVFARPRPRIHVVDLSTDLVHGASRREPVLVAPKTSLLMPPPFAFQRSGRLSSLGI